MRRRGKISPSVCDKKATCRNESASRRERKTLGGVLRADICVLTTPLSTKLLVADVSRADRRLGSSPYQSIVSAPPGAFQFSIRMANRNLEVWRIRVSPLSFSLSLSIFFLSFFHGSLAARLAFKINVQCTYGFLCFVRITQRWMYT